MPGVKIQDSFSVHLIFPRIPLVKVDGDFPRVLRLIGFGILEFSIEEAVQNAENLIGQVERRYQKIGKRALNELLSVWPDFIHHPRVQGLLKKAFFQGRYHFSRPPGRPKNRGGYLNDYIVFSVVEYLCQPPFQMSLRKAWKELADKWKTSYSSVRDSYQRARQRFKPLAIIDRSSFPQNEDDEVNIKGEVTKEKIRLEPLEWITRERLTDDLQLVHRFRLTSSGTIYVKSHYEVNEQPCSLIVQPELRGKSISVAPLG